jgi:hypothetical protein
MINQDLGFNQIQLFDVITLEFKCDYGFCDDSINHIILYHKSYSSSRIFNRKSSKNGRDSDQ